MLNHLHFQSHYGLILSIGELDDIYAEDDLSIPLWSDFISMKRHTKSWSNTLSIPLWSDFIHRHLQQVESYLSLFQSHYGLILSKRKRCMYYFRELPFNPTMVWFYRSLSCCVKSWCSSFQSHYGLILSRNESLSCLCICKAFNPTMVWFYLSLFCQIPTPVRVLSIPLWSDFIEPKPVEHYVNRFAFQSHYGLILSNSPSPITENDIAAFNPTMVWFYQFAAATDCGSKNSFQSHYGLILSLDDRKAAEVIVKPFNPTMVWFYR